MAVLKDRTKNPVGRPLKYKTAAELQKAIDKYFEDCEGTLLTDKDGKPMLNKYGDPIYINRKPYTMSGLALGIGFIDRQALLNYADREEFYPTVRAARAKVENYAETRLYDKEGSNGAKFSLANNFKGWKDKQEVELNANINVESYLSECEDTEEF